MSRGHVAGQLRDQAASCAAMGSPLYADLLERAAGDVEADGPAWALLEAHVAPGRGDALALRLMAAVHRLVLTGRAPELARHYPSVGGDGDAGAAWPAFQGLLKAEREALAVLLRRGCQTNEVGRSAALAFGFLEVAARTGLPLRLLEVGASAGLNLRFDHFRYGGGGVEWGDPGSPVDLRGLWAEAPPHLPPALRVTERRGCDLHPLDPANEDDRLALAASVWADQVSRCRRLEGALQVARRVPATVDRASAEDWLPARLGVPRPGEATVVFHSIVDEYLSGHVRGDVQRTIEAALDRATAQAPVAWLHLEPVSQERYHAARLTLSAAPFHERRRLAVCGAHGTDVRRAG